MFPPVVYRYFREAKYADMMARGEFRLSTLSSCRAYEDAEQGDAGEGTQTYLSGHIVGGSGDPSFVEMARRAGISIGPGCSGIQISNCVRFNTVPDAYLLCTSLFRDDQYFSKSFGSYCVEIAAPALFMRHVSNLLFALGHATEGACAPVVYRERTYTGLEPMPHPVFVKPASPYAPQREFRFAWNPAGNPREHIDLVMPHISHLFRRVA